jgi:hypothetical protein
MRESREFFHPPQAEQVPKNGYLYWERKPYFVYMLASKKNGTLYIGITSDLI